MLRSRTKNKNRAAIAAAVVGAAGAAAVLPSTAGASVFGALSNFDVVNDTGKPAYGFEIEIEDLSFDHTRITSVFGYDRVFPFVSPDPGAVVRFGSPTITDLVGGGVRITYGGTFGGTATPTGTYNAPSDSCWPGANPNWLNNPCDHFGVSTIGSPSATRYYWLVEDQFTPGTLTRQVVGLPSVGAAYTPPPAPGAPAVINARIQPVLPNENEPQNDELWGTPYWVKTFTINVGDEIDLGDLLRGGNGNPDLELAEIEIEWRLFQKPPAAEGDGELDELANEFDDENEAVVRRYEFYQYRAEVNPEDGEARCDNPFNCAVPFDDAVGNFLGNQMAGFQVMAAAVPIALRDANVVPEPGTLALFSLGLADLGFSRRRRA